MAVAEARAAWQRTANRCFVQEDAKRAPKLACCPSTSSSSKQLDAGPVNPAEGQDNPTPGFVPPNRNPSYSNLPPDSRWWLQMQPDYGHQRGLTNEQLNTLDVEMETSKHSGARLKNDEDGGPSVYAHNRIFDTCIKKEPEDKMQDLKAVYNKDAQESLKVKDVDEPFELIEMDPIGCVVSKKQDELCFESDSPWIRGEKTEPWWRKADRDELASFVAQRSLDHIENCDLPQPQNTHVKMDPFAHIGGLDGNGIGIFHPSKDYKPRCVSLPNPIVHKQSNLTSGSECGTKWASVEGYSQFATDKPISDFTSHKGTTEMHIDGNDPSKAQLLEALRHSQTRAREAEKAAQQAYAEKEDILKLFFRQASHLFAYKQWFQLLQLENFYFQIKNNKDQLASGLGLLPLLPHKTRKLKKNSQKPAKGKRAKRGRARYDIFSKYAVFALGLSLVGAGLLLGWTVGWMLPAL